MAATVAQLQQDAGQIAQQYNIDPGIFSRLIQQESSWNPQAVSSAGAVGLGQLEPATAAYLGVDPTDPTQNMDGAARYLSQLLQQYGGDYSLALAAYNAGPGAVDAYGGIPPYAETQQYVQTVLGSGPATSQAPSGGANVVSAPPQLSASDLAQIAQYLQQIQGGSGQSAAAPMTAVTGSDIVSQGIAAAQALAAAQNSANQTAGYYDPNASFGGATSLSPTLSRDQLNAQIADANRQYALDVQRFGLSVAQQAFTQRMDELNALTALQGPGDWLKYNYAIHNLPYSGTPNPTPQQAAGPAMDLSGMMSFAQNPTPYTQMVNQQSGPTYSQAGPAPIPRATPPPAPNAAAPLTLNSPAAMSAAQGQSSMNPAAAATALQQMYNSAGLSHPQSAQQGTGGSAPNPDANYQPFPGSKMPTATGAAPTPAGASVPAGMGNSSGLTADQLNAMIMSQSPPGTAGSIPLRAYGGMSAQVPMLAMGGQANMAVVGDQQRGQRGPNPELAMSATPITVMPMNRMPEHLARFAMMMPHYATGGSTVDPYMQGLGGGQSTSPFAASGLGEPWGQQPFNYTNYLQKLPSEQAMLQGYVNTPTAMGGLGGYFPDELARAQAAQFRGNSYEWFGPATYGG